MNNNSKFSLKDNIYTILDDAKTENIKVVSLKK